MPILVIHPGAMGDLTCAFPAIRRLRRITDQLNGVIAAAWIPMTTRLGIFDRHHSIESAVFAALYGSETSAALQQWLAAYETILAFTVGDEMIHGLRRHTAADVHVVRPRPEHPIAVSAYVAQQVMDLDIWQKGHLCQAPSEPPTAPRSMDLHGSLIIHPGASSADKRLPVTVYVRIGNAFRARGHTIRYLAGPAEPDLKSALPAAGVEDGHLLSPADTGQLTEILQSARGLIGNDSGVSHLSAYIGLPTVALFGPTDPVRWSPHGPRATVVRLPAPYFGTGNSALLTEPNPYRCNGIVGTVLAAFDKVDDAGG